MGLKKEGNGIPPEGRKNFRSVFGSLKFGREFFWPGRQEGKIDWKKNGIPLLSDPLIVRRSRPGGARRRRKHLRVLGRY